MFSRFFLFEIELILTDTLALCFSGFKNVYLYGNIIMTCKEGLYNMETMGECIYAWMNAEDITVSRFAEKLGYKSKTSLFRLLHGKSNYQSYVQFCEVLAPYLDDGWKNRFHQALLTEKYGKRRHALLKEMNCCLFGNGDMKTDASHIKASSIFSGGTVTILGCVWPGVFHFIDELLAAKEGPQVIHYFTHRDLFDSSCLLPGLISHMVCMNYSAMLLDETGLYGAHVPWNIVLWINENKAHILFINYKEKYAWQPLSGGAAQAQHIIGALNTLPQTALYRYDHLQTGKDYIAFTEQSYRMEYKRKTLILKPTPGMQMLPADIVEHSFIDYLAERIEPLSAARNTLIYIYEKRVQNFYSHIKPTYLVFSLEAMLRFARDGVMDDQFFACRPFAETERIEVFRTLQSFSKNENVFVSFLDQPNWPISVEAYDGVGVLFYPSSSDYHTANSVYREMFLPGKEYSDLLFQFAGEYMVFFDDPKLKSSDEIYKKLTHAVTLQNKT